MTLSTDRELIARWRDEPAPLLPLLHAFHDRDGHLSEEALRAVSKGLGLPLAELFGTVTFYHHFARQAGGLQAPRVCTGPVCCLKGGQELLAALEPAGATAMPCAGRCDEPIPVLEGDRVLVGHRDRELAVRPTPLPPPRPDGGRECVFAEIRTPGRHTLEGYRASGGYAALVKAVESMAPAGVIDLITDSQLAGRGGAGFPTGAKWKAVAEALGKPKTIVCNADEGEPGCFKDRAVLDHDPHAVIEGMVLAAYATGATQGFIYLRYEYPHTVEILERALAEARQAGLLGAGILGADVHFQLWVRRGAGAYICGEEGSLLNSLEGKHPFPRNRPPYPVTHGYDNLPTVVNNVETLASVAPIVRQGRRGTGLWATTARPAPKSSACRAISGGPAITKCLWACPCPPCWTIGPAARGRGAPSRRSLWRACRAAFWPAAICRRPWTSRASAARGRCWEPAASWSLTIAAIWSPWRTRLWSFSPRNPVVSVSPAALAPSGSPSACRGRAGPHRLAEWRQEVGDIGRTMQETSACGLGQAAPFVTESLMKYFPEQVARHVEGGSVPKT